MGGTNYYLLGIHNYAVGDAPSFRDRTSKTMVLHTTNREGWNFSRSSKKGVFVATNNRTNVLTKAKVQKKGPKKPPRKI